MPRQRHADDVVFWMLKIRCSVMHEQHAVLLLRIGESTNIEMCTACNCFEKQVLVPGLVAVLLLVVVVVKSPTLPIRKFPLDAKQPSNLGLGFAPT